MKLPHEPREDARLIAIGDVHGCLHELNALLKKVGWTFLDRLLFLGDVLDRGPYSNDTVRYVRGLCKDGLAFCLLGNHEEKHIRYEYHEERRRKLGHKNPMKFSDARLEEHKNYTLAELGWMSELPPFVRFRDGGRDWIASHAGVPANKPIEEQNIRKLIRTRHVNVWSGEYASTGDPNEVAKNAVYWAKRWRGPESVVHGHIVWSEPEVAEIEGVLTVGIDTGCCFGGMLTAAIFTGKGGRPELVSVPAEREYHPRRGGPDGPGRDDE